MFRRSLMFALASIALLSAAPLSGEAQIATPRTIARESADRGFPASLGGMRLQGVETNENGTTFVRYTSGRAVFDIIVYRAAAGQPMPDGADTSAAAQVLDEVAEAVADAYRRERTPIRLLQRGVRLTSGDRGNGWSWLANSHEFLHPQHGRMERIDLVTGFAGRPILVTIMRPRDDNTSPIVAGAVRELTVLLAGSRQSAARNDDRPQGSTAPAPYKGI